MPRDGPTGQSDEMHNCEKSCTKEPWEAGSTQRENKDAEPSVDQAISGAKSDFQASAPFTFRDWLVRSTTPLNTASPKHI